MTLEVDKAGKYIIGTLLLVILATGIIYISMGEKARIRVDADKTTFYVKNEANQWVVSGREYNRLFAGTKIQGRDTPTITITTETHNTTITEPTYEHNNWTDANGTLHTESIIKGYTNATVVLGVTITRSTGYRNGAVIIDTYNFDGSTTDIELFPVSHKVEVINASGMFYRYTVDDLKGVGAKRKLSGETSASFGLNMKVELHPKYNWAWVGYPYGSDSISAQYSVDSDYEVFNVRLFDPLIGTYVWDYGWDDVTTLNDWTITNTPNITASILRLNSDNERILQEWQTSGEGSTTNFTCKVSINTSADGNCDIGWEGGQDQLKFYGRAGDFTPYIDTICNTAYTENIMYIPYDTFTTWYMQYSRAGTDWWLYAENRTLIYNCTTAGSHENFFIRTDTVSSIECQNDYIMCWNGTVGDEPNNLTQINLTLNSGTASLDVELGSTINVSGWLNADDSEVCISSTYPSIGRLSCSNTGYAEALLNVTHFTLSLFNDSNTSVTYSSGTTLGFHSDNRSEILAAKVNVYSDNVENVTLNYYGQTKAFKGNLIGTVIVEDEFYHTSWDTSQDLEYRIAGEKLVTYNATATPYALYFRLWGIEMDKLNPFTYTERFNSTSNISALSTATYPTWQWDNFTTDTRTSRYETGTGTYNTTVDLVDKRYEGSCQSSSSGGSGVDTDNVKMAFLAQNLSRLKRVYFRAGGSSTASCVSLSGYSGESYGAASTTLALTTSPTATTYTTLDSSYAEAYCGSTQYGESHAQATTFGANYTLIRVEDDASTFSFNVYENDVFLHTVETFTGDINIAYIGGTESSSVGGSAQGGGSQNIWIDDVRYSGVANSYTDALNYSTNSSVISGMLFDAPTNIRAATLTAIEYVPATCDTTYYLSNTNGVTYEEVFSGSRHIFTTTGKNITWLAFINCTSREYTGAIIEVDIDIVPSATSNISIDANSDGVSDFSYIGTINETISPVNVSFNSSVLTDSIGIMVLSITSESSGVLTMNDSQFNTTPNPITLNYSLFEYCNNCEVNFTFDGSILTFNSLNISYLGGNQTILIYANSTANISLSLARNLTYYYSGWNYTMPRYIEYLEFIPKRSTDKNVTPYGQTRYKPIFNISMKNYGTNGANFTIRVNETYSCVNLSASPTYNKTQGQQLNTSWYTLATYKDYGDYLGVWLWADYQCNISAFRTWNPYISLRACCVSCTVCDVSG